MECLNKKSSLIAGGCLFTVGVLLTVILVPLTFSYVEYYEYGIKQRKATGFVDTSKVYGRGRYNLGPGYKFIKYRADAHHEDLKELSVFSAAAGGSNESIGLEFLVDVDFTYLLKRDELGLLHQELASSYENIIASRTREAIKNEAVSVTFEEYFQERKAVEDRFRAAVETRWEENPPLHCTLDQFHLGRIRIPESVAQRQLESKLQNERNDREAFLQEARIEREKTAVEVNEINLEKASVLRAAAAEADLIRAVATSEAKRLVAEAQINGTKFLFESANITDQEHMTAFTYIRTLINRDNLDLDVGYLTPDNILRTKVV